MLYFRYDPNRIIAYQGRKPERFYYIMTGKGKHFEINHIFVNYECHISEVGVKTLYSRTDCKSVCSDKEN